MQTTPPVFYEDKREQSFKRAREKKFFAISSAMIIKYRPVKK